VVDPPVQPDGNAGDDEGIAVEESRRFGRHSPREVLQEKLVLFSRRSLGAFAGFGSAHFDD